MRIFSWHYHQTASILIYVCIICSSIANLLSLRQWSIIKVCAFLKKCSLLPTSVILDFLCHLLSENVEFCSLSIIALGKIWKYLNNCLNKNIWTCLHIHVKKLGKLWVTFIWGTCACFTLINKESTNVILTLKVWHIVSVIPSSMVHQPQWHKAEQLDT